MNGKASEFLETSTNEWKSYSTGTVHIGSFSVRAFKSN